MVRDDCFRCNIDFKWRQLLVKCFYAKWLNLLAHSHVFREPGLDSDRGSEIKSFKLGGTLHTSNVFQSRPMFISPNFLPWAKAMTQGSYRSRRTVILCFFFAIVYPRTWVTAIDPRTSWEDIYITRNQCKGFLKRDLLCAYHSRLCRRRFPEI